MPESVRQPIEHIYSCLAIVPSDVSKTVYFGKLNAVNLTPARAWLAISDFHSLRATTFAQRANVSEPASGRPEVRTHFDYAYANRLILPRKSTSSKG